MTNMRGLRGGVSPSPVRNFLFIAFPEMHSGKLYLSTFEHRQRYRIKIAGS